MAMAAAEPIRVINKANGGIKDKADKNIHKPKDMKAEPAMAFLTSFVVYKNDINITEVIPISNSTPNQPNNNISFTPVTKLITDVELLLKPVRL